MPAPPNSIRKLRRLLALANDSDSPESRTAKCGTRSFRYRLYPKVWLPWATMTPSPDSGLTKPPTVSGR